MCGIIGIFNYKNKIVDYRSDIKSFYEVSNRRGSQSSGAVFYSNKEDRLYVFKKNKNYSKLLSDKNLKLLLKKFSNNDFIVGHTRMETNGNFKNNINNQPILTENSFMVHNGIICNHNEIFDSNNFNRETELDSESIIRYLDSNILSKSISEIINDLNKKFEGTINIIYYNKMSDKIFVYSNNGSLYYYNDTVNGKIVVLSEEIFFIKNQKLFFDFDITKLKQLSSEIFITISLNDMRISSKNVKLTTQSSVIKPRQIKPMFKSNNEFSNDLIIKKDIYNFKTNWKKIEKLKRCTKCILPETFPFIEFDKKGVCNYCNNYKKIQFKGKKSLINDINLKLNPRLLVTLSGGRDSCYGLHYMKEVLGFNVVSYSYDWGLVTDLARRNQARMCSKLGIEHILVSADINRKRKNVKMNLSAWLEKPKIGLLPLIIAGDKQYFEYANIISKEKNVSDIILCENMLETTHFKTGYLGIKPNFKNNHTFSLNIFSIFQMMNNYFFEYLRNPKYLNPSLLDTLRAFLVYYFLPKNYINMFNYIEWDENDIVNTLVNEYNWELSKSSKTTTWRIGDGTAAFYNYIYLMFGGFTEFDTFRSNQIREGLISRSEALKLSHEENQTRESDFDWYCKTIGLDTKEVLKKINMMKSNLDKY